MPIQQKQKNKAYFILLSIILFAALAYFTFLSYAATPAPDVSFKTITNKKISLKNLRGKAVLITFWASNCPSCIKEISHFKRLYQDYHTESGLEIIAIAMHYDRPNYVVDASKAYQVPYDIVLDLDNRLATAFGDVSLTPTTFLLSPKGNIVFQTTGAFDLKAMQSRIESMMPESNPQPVQSL